MLLFVVYLFVVIGLRHKVGLMRIRKNLKGEYDQSMLYEILKKLIKSKEKIEITKHLKILRGLITYI